MHAMFSPIKLFTNRIREKHAIAFRPRGSNDEIKW